MNKTPASKEAVVLKLLAEGDTMLCLDARRAGVRVPPQHTHDPALRLILNLNFPRPIDVTSAGISASLSFGGRRFACFIPMEALWAVFKPQTMQGMMWPESMPPEVLANFTAQQQEGQQAAPGDAVEQPARPRMRVEKSQKKTPKHAAEPPPPRQRGHLRVIK
jgi:stringent starvation protein B